MKANQVGIRYGYRRIKAMLRSAGWVVNVNRVARIVATSANVRFGSEADIRERDTNVRFTPKSGHRPLQIYAGVALTSRISSARARCSANAYFV